MFWDSRVQSLEFQALVPIRNREEMRGDASSDAGALRLMVGRLNQIKEYRDRFHASFDGPIDELKVSQAIAAYERSLIVTNAPFDRFMRGDVDAMSPLQQQGMKAFQKAGCALCHNGPMLSDFKLHSIGITDRERHVPTLDPFPPQPAPHSPLHAQWRPDDARPSHAFL